MVVAVTDHRPAGEVVRVASASSAASALVAGRRRGVVVQLGAALRDAEITPGESLLADRRALVAWASVARTDVEELTLEEVPDVTWPTSAGSTTRSRRSATRSSSLPGTGPVGQEVQGWPPKGVLLYRPPGCGKDPWSPRRWPTRPGRRSLNIKGPELLNKYVGETERQIRLTFARAREVAAEAGRPVIVFSTRSTRCSRRPPARAAASFRRRGRWCSCWPDRRRTSLANVIVIGATDPRGP